MNIFLDFDGTLVDIKPRHYEVYRSCLLAIGGKPLPMEQYWGLKRQDEKWSKILPLSGVDRSLEADFLFNFISKIEEPDILDIDKLFSGSLAVLQSLSDEHTLTLVSLRRNHDNLIGQLEKLQIVGYFNNILSGHSDTKEGVLLKKAEVIKTINGYENGIVIGDAEADISAAKQLGLPVIAVTTGIRSKGFLSKLEPTYLVDSIDASAFLIK